uniref:Small heat shock protein n=1 Tax=Lissorhoptrus oryzophilus TaxID=308863 RepID=A0A0B4L0I5_9CUCU|nr:small heat shock protein [Lissorhoptrus oryzophilus]
MSLFPFFDDLFYSSRCPARRSWDDPWFSTEDIVSPLKSALSTLAQIDKDNSITLDKDQFQANIDVQQFKPGEITVKLTDDNTVTVEGKHEEKQDEHGFISRHFVRRYVLPEDCDVKKVQSKLSSDGVLSISAPKKPESKKDDYKQIPITMTGPVKSVEQQPKEDESKRV